MTLTLKNNLLLKVTLVLVVSTTLSWCLFSKNANAQGAQVISVSPTLFDVTAAPSQPWESYLRVVNVNAYEIQVYVDVVNFAPLGESGRGSLIPVVEEETKGGTLAEWVTINRGPVTILPQETATIPFTLRVPENAPPGGHYAALLVGTKPPESNPGASTVQTAQFVTSLLFLRVAGDVVEAADIREFRAVDSFVQKPDTSFIVRFENKGSVHVQPQGEIKIFNMWGAERGIIPVNHQTDFGNVLPNSIREFQFAWNADVSLYDMGRYEAIATLTYGEESKQFASASTYFWVVPIKQLLILIVVIALIGGLLVLSVRLYVRRMLALAGIEPNPIQRHRFHEKATLGSKETSGPVKTVVVKKYSSALAPARYELRALRKLFIGWKTPRVFIGNLSIYLTTHWRLVVLFIGLLLGLSVIIWFVGMVKEKAVSYEVMVQSQNENVTYSAEDIEYNNLRARFPRVSEPETAPVSIVNASGQLGAAAKVKVYLEDAGVTVTPLTTDPERHDRRTVVVFRAADEQLAKRVSELLGGALMSYSTENSTENSAGVVVYVGTDVENLPQLPR